MARYKKEDIFLQKYLYVKYMKEIVPIVTQCYTSGAHMVESVGDPPKNSDNRKSNDNNKS